MNNQVSWDVSRWVCCCGCFKDRIVFILGTMIIWNIRNKANHRHIVTFQKTEIFKNTPVRTSNAEFQLIKYRAIQEESQYCFDVIVSVIVKKSSYEHIARILWKRGQPMKGEFYRRSIKNRFLRNFPLYCKQIICAAKISFLKILLFLLPL